MNTVFVYFYLINSLLFSEIYRSFFALAQALWTKQNKGDQSADKIREILGKLLPTPNDTRWNSTCDAMRALCDQKPKLDSVMDALNLRRFNAQELIFLEEYITLTTPLAICLDVLQGDSASLGVVLPTIAKLQTFWENKISDESLVICGVMAKFLLWDLKERTTHLFNDKDYILGKYLVNYYVPTFLK